MSGQCRCLAQPYEEIYLSHDYNSDGSRLPARGAALRCGMEDASHLPDLVTELARQGYSKEDLEKVLGGNVLRVMQQVIQVSRKMQTEGSAQ
jgi:microsomal dipeptidase-like Zn-dependent dipeptidase